MILHYNYTMKNFKMGFVTILGRPNTGKSTLLNRIIGQKIAVTTSVAQTTRRKIRGIYNDKSSQIVFLDTPGVHKPLNKLGEHLIQQTKEALEGTDLILFIVDAYTHAGKGDKWIVDNMLQTDVPIILVLNKVDMLKNPQMRELNVYSYKKLFKKNITTCKISAKTGRNIDTLIKTIIKMLPEGIPVYDTENITDETMRDITEEIVREKILLNTRDEIPHAVAVKVEEYIEKDEIDRIKATIYVQTQSQKKIIIGKCGSMIKKIGTEARFELEKTAQKKVYLELFVKVERKWYEDVKLI